MFGAAARRALLQNSSRAREMSTVKKYLAKVYLDDWKYSVPLGIILAIPVIQNEMLILSEETQLVACFMVFCGTAYNLGANSVSEYLDGRTKGIISAQNESEEIALVQMKEMIAEQEKAVKTLTMLKTLPEVEAELTEELKVIRAQQFKHETRNKIAKMLDTIAQKEENIRASTTSMLVNEATKAVTAKFDDQATKDKSLNEAIDILSSGGSSKLVASLFSEHFKAESAKAAKVKGTEVSLSKEQIAHVQDELNAIFARDDPDMPKDQIPAAPTKVLI